MINKVKSQLIDQETFLANHMSDKELKYLNAEYIKDSDKLRNKTITIKPNLKMDERFD